MRRARESGNVFFTLFGAVAMVGVVTAATSSLMRGPVGTVVSINQKAKVDAQLQIARQLSGLASVNNICIDDGIIMPLPPSSGADCVSPTGGGCLPSAVGAAKNDPWGTSVGYCAWNHTICPTDSGVLDGGNPQEPVIAIISAGADRQFQTVCSDSAPYVQTPPGSDDIVFSWTYDEAADGVGGGLWSLKSNDGTTATIDKKLDIVQDTAFGAGMTAAFQDSARLDFSGGGLLNLPDQTNSGACNGANDGMLRVNTADGRVLQICDPSDDWVDIGGSGAANAVAGLPGEIQFNAGDELGAHSGLTYSSVSGTLAVGTGGTAITAAGAVNIDGNVSITGTNDLTVGGDLAVTSTSNLGVLNATGAVDFDTTLNVDGATTLRSTLDAQGAVSNSVGANVLVDDGLRVTGAATLEDNLLVGGNSVLEGTLDAQDNIFNSVGAAVVVNDDLTVNEDLLVSGAAAATSFRLGSLGSTTGMFGGANIDLRIGGDNRLSIDSFGDVTIAQNLGVGGVLDVSGEVVVGLATMGCDAANHYGALRYDDFDDVLQLCTAAEGWVPIGAEGGGGAGSGSKWTGTTDIYRSSGNVGIGTDAPATKLNVIGDVGAARYCDEDGAFCFFPEDISDGAIGAPGDQNQIIFHSGGLLAADPNFVFDSAGNVGVGTGTVTDGLRAHIEGPVGATAFCNTNGQNCFGADAIAFLSSGKVEKISADLTVTVGGGGDYATINEALEYLSTHYPTYKESGFTAEIRLLTGFTMAEQVLVEGIDLGWITITADDAVVSIDDTALTTAFGYPEGWWDFYPAFGVRNGALPVIGALFEMGAWDGTHSYQSGIFALNARVLVRPGAGVTNGYIGLYAASSQVFALQANFSGDSHSAIWLDSGTAAYLAEANVSGADFGLYASGGTNVEAGGIDASGTGFAGIYAYNGSAIAAGNADVSGANQDGIVASSASSVSAYQANVSGVGRYGILATDASRILATGADISNAGSRAADARNGSFINVSDADLSNAAGYGAFSTGGSLVRGHNANASGAGAAGFRTRYGSEIIATGNTGGATISMSGSATYGRILTDNGYVVIGKKVGIGVANPGVEFDVAGIMRAVDDSAGCTATERGAIRFNSAGAAVEYCDGGGWDRLITTGDSGGALPAGGADRQIQFNSGGVLYASSGLVFTSAGNVGIGTTNPDAKLDVAGGVKMANDNATCDASKEGTQRYNSTLKAMQFCDGTDWKGFGGLPTCPEAQMLVSTGAGWQCAEGVGCSLDSQPVLHGISYTFYSVTDHYNCNDLSQSRLCSHGILDGDSSFQYASCTTIPGPTGCEQIGDQCPDGSYFVGDSPADGAWVFMTTVGHENAGSWEEDPPCDLCGDGTVATSTADGRVNVDAMRNYDQGGASSGTLDGFAAAKYCDQLSAHGHDDWYLPAGGSGETELNLLWEMVQLVGLLDLDSDVNYWSSTEGASSSAWSQRFSDGAQIGGDYKANGAPWRVARCVRRE